MFRRLCQRYPHVQQLRCPDSVSESGGGGVSCDALLPLDWTCTLGCFQREWPKSKPYIKGWGVNRVFALGAMPQEALRALVAPNPAPARAQTVPGLLLATCCQRTCARGMARSARSSRLPRRETTALMPQLSPLILLHSSTTQSQRKPLATSTTTRRCLVLPAEWTEASVAAKAVVFWHSGVSCP